MYLNLLLNSIIYKKSIKLSKYCKGCQKREEDHTKTDNTKKEWDFEKCTKLETTDAYSLSKRVLKFDGLTQKTAKVKFL